MDGPYPPLDASSRQQIDSVVSLVRDVLGDDLVGVYLYGSAVVGGLKPDSDVDLLVLASRHTSAAEKRRLVETLIRLSGRGAASGPARSIELTVVADPDVRPWRYPPSVDFQYGDWLRQEFQRGDAVPWDEPNPDLAILLETARSASIAIVGPPLATVVPPVPRADLVRAMDDGIPGLLADIEGDTRNVLLTLARIWTTVATGEIQPKDAAADWALGRLPEDRRGALARARDRYLGVEPGPDAWSDRMARARATADAMVAAIRQLIAA